MIQWLFEILIFKYNMSHSNLLFPQSSLEESLTVSIRRAKERIFNSSNASNTILHDFSLQSEPSRIPINQSHQQDSRQRASSQRNYSNVTPNSGKEEGKALVGAMKTLQDRIGQLEKENQLLKEQVRPEPTEKNQGQHEKDISKLIKTLNQKEQEMNKLSRVNSDLKDKNNDLLQKIAELEEQLQNQTNRRTPNLQDQFISTLQQQRQSIERTNPVQNTSQALLSQKDLQIAQLQAKIRELELRNNLSHETITKLMRNLEEEKKQNLKWIHMMQDNITSEHKENDSIAINQTEAKPKPRQTELKKGYSQLLKNNKEMYDTIQKNKTKFIEMSRDIKQAEQRYTNLKHLVNQVIGTVHKILPHPNNHLCFLMKRIQKLDKAHLESLRSFSTHSRKSLLRPSRSNDRKKSLKMEDLNASSNKKSHQRSSAGKSSRKRYTLEPMNSSEKKPKLIANEEVNEIETLEKQVKALRRQHRNLVIKLQKNDSQTQSNKKQMQQISNAYEIKKTRMQELRKKQGLFLGSGKKERNPLLV